MASGMTLTEAGRNLLAKALSGKTLTFTKAATGNGDLGSRNPYNMTALVSKKLDLPVTAMRVSAVGTAEITVEINNSNLSTGFFMKEYGLYAKTSDSSSEVLYAYCNKGNESGYLEAFDGTNPINFTLSLITVIDTAQNITANITVSNQYVTATSLDAKLEALFAPSDTPAGFFAWKANDNRRLRPLSLEDTRNALTGISDIPSLVDRVKALENAIASISLALNAQEIYPGAARFMAEDFADPDTIDLYTAQITSIIAGDDSIDCTPLNGLIPGSIYTVTDGSKSEYVQVQSVNLENDIMRVILYDTIKNTYNLSNCRLIRSTADIQSGSAYSSPVLRKISWLPGITWQGRTASQSFSVKLDSSVAAAGNFYLSGNATLNSSGSITLGG